ncbi:hypothetical protein [Allostreptomyces psammosilenae]|uniref:Uncharacterized protein n=1 Tax=Allostreptomyces psammosilenae TaxID=1892865 RepID=A0A852ZY06_9ACTN|nr:hypothetical protein [Allostreptomyces psammosilenae]NYI03162.1 hypothetical protein [Allostreptomyces psammosilenae]
MTPLPRPRRRPAPHRPTVAGTGPTRRRPLPSPLPDSQPTGRNL